MSYCQQCADLLKENARLREAVRELFILMDEGRVPAMSDDLAATDLLNEARALAAAEEQVKPCERCSNNERRITHVGYACPFAAEQGEP